MAQGIVKFALCALIALPAAAFELGKQSARTAAISPQGGDTIAGSIELPLVALTSDQDRLELPAITSADYRTGERVRIILAQASSPPNSNVGPRETNFSSSKRETPELPPQFDANYNEWQKHADEKLADEKTAEPKEHPLSTANPDSYVVICLGGCRPQSDLITYRVSKKSASAAAIATRKLEIASVATGGDANKVEGDPHQSSVCVAGCYSDDDIEASKSLKKAEIEEDHKAAEDRKAARAGSPRSSRMQASNAAVESHSKPGKIAQVKTADASTSRAIAPVQQVGISAPLLKIHRISAETHARAVKKRILSSKAVQLARLNWRASVKRSPDTREAASLRLTKKAFARKDLRRGRAAPVKIVTEASGFVF